MTSQYRIAVEDLSIEYKTTPTLKVVISRLSFEVAPDTVLSILGTNGSGKSTLLGSIAGLIKPTTGSTKVLPTQPTDSQVATIAFLHQDYRQTNYPWTSVFENVTYPLRFRGLHVNERTERAIRILNEILPEVGPTKPAYELSGGQQQLLAIARALISTPDVLLGDEPLSAADSVRAMRAIQAINSARDSNKFPMIWVSHDIDEALLLGDTIALLSRRTHGFSAMIQNPIPRPRTHLHLAMPEMAKLKATILDFLLSDHEQGNPE